MAIEPKFTAGQVRKVLEERLERIEAAIVQRLQFVGEKFVINARGNENYESSNLRDYNGSYKDRTGNLRSSIGYVILKNGEQLSNFFPGSKATGKKQGATVAETIAKKHPKGFVLIVVAGMEYAAAVESKNYDVITSSSITAESDLKKAIQELTAKIGKMK